MHAEKSPTSCARITQTLLWWQPGHSLCIQSETDIIDSASCLELTSKKCHTTFAIKSRKLFLVKYQVRWTGMATEQTNGLWSKHQLLQDTEVNMNLQSRSFMSFKQYYFAKYYFQKCSGRAGSGPCPWCSPTQPRPASRRHQVESDEFLATALRD